MVSAGGYQACWALISDGYQDTSQQRAWSLVVAGLFGSGVILYSEDQREQKEDAIELEGPRGSVQENDSSGGDEDSSWYHWYWDYHNEMRKVLVMSLDYFAPIALWKAIYLTVDVPSLQTINIFWYSLSITASAVGFMALLDVALSCLAASIEAQQSVEEPNSAGSAMSASFIWTTLTNITSTGAVLLQHQFAKDKRYARLVYYQKLHLICSKMFGLVVGLAWYTWTFHAFAPHAGSIRFAVVTLVIAVLLSCVLAQYSAEYALQSDTLYIEDDEAEQMCNTISILKAENARLRQIIVAHGLPLGPTGHDITAD